MNRTTDYSPARDTLALVARLLIAYQFVPSGWAKITGFAGTVGYIGSQGVPMPEVASEEDQA